MKSSVNQPLKCGNYGEKLKSQYEAPINASNPNRGQPAYKRHVFLVFSLNSVQAFKMKEHLRPLRLPINEIFNTIKDQAWIKRPKSIQYNPTLSGAEEYCSYHNKRDTRQSIVEASRNA